MTSSRRELPVSPDPNHLRKQAKARLAEMRLRTPTARLTEAQLVLAREYGFPAWAALQAEVARRAPAGLVPFRRMPEGERDDALQVFLRIGMVMQVGVLLILLAGAGLLTVALHQGLPFGHPPAIHHRQAS